MPRGGTAGHKPRRATGSTRDFALGPDYQLTAGSVAAIDKGIPLSMGTNAAIAGTPLNTPIFAGVFSQDIAHQAVPCGDAPDIGASEYCGGVPLVWPGPSDGNSCPGAVGTPTATGGASSTGGNANANTGGTEPSGGVSSSGGDSSIVAQGGSSATGGAVSSGVGSGAAIPEEQGNGATGGIEPVTSSGDSLGAGGAEEQAEPGPTTADAGDDRASSDAEGDATTATGGDPFGPDAVSGGPDKGGCSCRIAGTRSSDPSGLAHCALALIALALGSRRPAALRLARRSRARRLRNPGLQGTSQ